MYTQDEDDLRRQSEEYTGDLKKAIKQLNDCIDFALQRKAVKDRHPLGQALGTAERALNVAQRQLAHVQLPQTQPHREEGYEGDRSGSGAEGEGRK